MEFIFVVKRTELFDLAYPQGFQRLADSELESRYLDRIRKRGFFVERRFAEQDSTLKQIIPYCVVCRGEKILLLRRLSGQGEKRLHNKLSIGVGGHINPQDGDGEVLERGTQRELQEELEIRGSFKTEPVGIINDDASDVGSVHFGIVQKVSILNGDVQIREKEMMEGNFVSLAELRTMEKEKESFESWSSYLLRDLDSLL